MRPALPATYRVDRSSIAFYRELLVRGHQGQQVLECGCDEGSHAFFLARRGDRVTAIDTCEAALARVRERAMAEDRGIVFLEMNADSLNFPDHSFDLVCGRGVMQTADPTQTMAEVARVLRPSGHAVFIEPLGHNPLINWYRKRRLKSRALTGYPLRMADLEHLETWFDHIEVRFFHLTALAATPFFRVPGFFVLLGMLDRLDTGLFTMVPCLKKLAWQVVIELSAPRVRGHG